MTKKRKHVCDLIAKDKNGDLITYTVLSAGRNLYVDDNVLGRSLREVEKELLIRFGAKVIERVRPEIYESKAVK